jgi:hypothetical protein
MDRNLSLGPREPGKHDEHAQSSLHRGLRIRLGHIDNSTKPSDAFASLMFGDIGAQLGDRDAA